MNTIVLMAAAVVPTAGTYFERYILAGGMLMLLLIPTSLIALSLIIQCAISLRRSRIYQAEDQRLFHRLAEEGTIDDLGRAAGQRSHTALGRMMATAAAMEVTLTPEREVDLVRHEIARLFRRVHVLAVIVNVAPIMGLLGTITGLMGTFTAYTTSVNPSLAELSSGLYEALVTTVWGLGIALPTSLCFHYFRSTLIRYEEDELPAALAPIARAMRERGPALFQRMHDAPTLLPEPARAHGNSTESLRMRATLGGGTTQSEAGTVDPTASTPSPSIPQPREAPIDSSDIHTHAPQSSSEVRLL